jgi:uncharacterized RDD family membrane protein YckC
MPTLLTGVQASAAQNAPVTKTCLQCGAVLSSSVRVCSFCDSSLAAVTTATADIRATHSLGSLAPDSGPGLAAEETREPGWQGELGQRLQAYRARKRKLAPNSAQSRLPFEDPREVPLTRTCVAVEQPPPPVEDDFSFTIAIGRSGKKREPDNARMVIDVSNPSDEPGNLQETTASGRNQTETPGLYPVASIDDRRLAALIDAACLLFAYGGFLALFGSVGGQFTLSKLSAAVCVATFSIVYMQYFALFTIFGGTTPGMMLRGLQVVSFSGEPPTPRQMLRRSAGYLLSAGTFFLGFLWAMWDEDELTWHDRISHTYLSSAETFADMETTSVAHTR